jgi:hypothetical protein
MLDGGEAGHRVIQSPEWRKASEPPLPHVRGRRRGSQGGDGVTNTAVAAVMIVANAGMNNLENLLD